MMLLLPWRHQQKRRGGLETRLRSGWRSTRRGWPRWHHA